LRAVKDLPRTLKMSPQKESSLIKIEHKFGVAGEEKP